MNNGSHWVVVSSRSAAGNWRVHDNWSSEVWSSPELDLQFHGLPQWASLFDPFTSYTEGTIITFERRTPATPSIRDCPVGQRCCAPRADGSGRLRRYSASPPLNHPRAYCPALTLRRAGSLLVGVWGEREYHPTRHDPRLQMTVRKVREVIEDDASAPARLLTTEDGYTLAGPLRRVRAGP